MKPLFRIAEGGALGYFSAARMMHPNEGQAEHHRHLLPEDRPPVSSTESN